MTRFLRLLLFTCVFALAATPAFGGGLWVWDEALNDYVFKEWGQIPTGSRPLILGASQREFERTWRAGREMGGQGVLGNVLTHVLPQTRGPERTLWEHIGQMKGRVTSERIRPHAQKLYWEVLGGAEGEVHEFIPNLLGDIPITDCQLPAGLRSDPATGRLLREFTEPHLTTVYMTNGGGCAYLAHLENEMRAGRTPKFPRGMPKHIGRLWMRRAFGALAAWFTFEAVKSKAEAGDYVGAVGEVAASEPHAGVVQLAGDSLIGPFMVQYSGDGVANQSIRDAYPMSAEAVDWFVEGFGSSLAEAKAMNPDALKEIGLEMARRGDQGRAPPPPPMSWAERADLLRLQQQAMQAAKVGVAPDDFAKQARIADAIYKSNLQIRELKAHSPWFVWPWSSGPQ
jgi:hypothetical protein